MILLYLYKFKWEPGLTHNQIENNLLPIITYSHHQENLYWLPAVQGTSVLPSKYNTTNYEHDTVTLYKQFNVKWLYFVIPMILHTIFVVTISALTIIALIKTFHKASTVSENSAQRCRDSSRRILFLNLGVIFQSLSYCGGVGTTYLAEGVHEYHLTVNAVLIPVWLSCYNPIVLLAGEHGGAILQVFRKRVFRMCAS